MKILHKKLTSLLLSLILLITGLLSVGMLGGLQKETARADEPTNYSSSVYYFSDSEPLMSEEAVSGVLGSYPVYYDIHYLSSQQELKYLLYTGYFWRFAGSYDVTLVIQITSFTPDDQILNDLAICFDRQDCKKLMWLIYGKPNDFNVTIPEDNFSIFLKEPFELGACLYNIPNNTALLIDGRLLGLYYDEPDFSPLPLLKYSTLRKLYEYLFFGLNDQKIIAHEEDFFGALWEFYRDNYLEYCGLDQEFGEITNIENYIEIWNSRYTDYGVSNSEFWEINREEYESFLYDTIRQYFTESDAFNDLTSRNVHFFAHVPNSALGKDNSFFDLFNGGKQSFDTYAELFDYLEMGSDYPGYSPITVCAMAQWMMTNEFYDFLYDAQGAIANKSYDFVWNIDELPVYLWKVDPIEWGTGGLAVEYEEKITLSEEEIDILLNALCELVYFFG